ncbi:MAG: tetratricopeptide repeat protein [Candidatus Heimdallarchaeota archaeon]|nr:tetratricopeptide repeat protein [Candidatus Heimdallarchaeota archaeon]
MNPQKVKKMTPQRTTKLLQEGLKALAEQRIKKALELFTKATKLDPEDTQAWNNRGVALRKLGEITEAIECYDKALAINPTIIQVLLNKARALKTLEALDHALLIYEDILVMEPEHSEAFQEFEELKKLRIQQQRMDRKIREQAKSKQLEATKIIQEKREFIQFLKESQRSITDAVDNTLQKQMNSQKTLPEVRKDCEKLIVAIKNFDQQTWERARQTASEFQFHDFVKECQQALAIWTEFTQQMLEKLHNAF